MSGDRGKRTLKEIEGFELGSLLEGKETPWQGSALGAPIAASTSDRSAQPQDRYPYHDFSKVFPEFEFGVPSRILKGEPLQGEPLPKERVHSGDRDRTGYR